MPETEPSPPLESGVPGAASARRVRYHHGNLPAALESTGFELARTGGPQAVTLREVARRAGVSATAAYRHYQDHDQLLRAVGRRARNVLADAMAAAGDAVSDMPEPNRSDARLRAILLAYTDFSRQEPGLFAIAFRVPSTAGPEPGSPPEVVMATAVAEVVRARGGGKAGPTSAVVWSAIHGVSALLACGLLAGEPRVVVGEVVESCLRLIDGA